MTCPYRTEILPSLTAFFRAFSPRVEEVLTSEVSWDGDVFSIVWKGDDGTYRISTAPRWQTELLDGYRKGDRVFRGDGLLLPADIEEALRYFDDFPEAAQPGAEVDFRDVIVTPEIANLCRDWIWRHERYNITAVRAFSETASCCILEQTFRWRFFDSHLPLAACLRVPKFDRLVDAHPQLAWFLARTMCDNDGLNVLSLRALHSQFRLGPIESLRMLRLPCERSLLQLLRRIHIDSLSDRLLDDLRIAASAASRISLLLSLSPPLFEEDIALLAAQPPAHPELVRAIHAKLLEEHWHDQRHVRNAPARSTALAYCRAARKATSGERQVLARIRSPQRLRVVTQRITCSPQLMGGWDGNPGQPLPAPAPDSSDVTFLFTPEKILQASLEFHNCARTYISAAAAGETAFYICHANASTGMLQLTRSLDDAWCAHELLAPYNKKPTAAVRQVAGQWLRQHGIPGFDP